VVIANTTKLIIVKVAEIGALSSPKISKKYSSATRPERNGAITEERTAPKKVLAIPIKR
jgi:hypothetical protein